MRKVRRVLAISVLVSVGLITGPAGRGFAAEPGESKRLIDGVRVQPRQIRELVGDMREARRLSSLPSKLLTLANDPTAYVDVDGEILFADFGLDEGAAATDAIGSQFVPAAPSGDALAVAPIATLSESPVVDLGVAPATGDPFTLNSRPGSTKTIYLDFDGETVTGSAWSGTFSFPAGTIVAPPFDRDGNPSSFNSTEQQIIRDTWQAVAKDFAPFDVNVTTQRPSVDAFTRTSAADPTYGVIAVVSNTNFCGLGCAGIAYVNVFSRSDLSYSPAWIFPPSRYSAIDIANTISHEVGHNLSLEHHGVIGGSPYYGGTATWGPIMGNPSSTYVQWSKGEYPLANNTLQDDVAQIAAQTGGFASDSSSSLGNAVLVAPGVNVTTSDDVINSAIDVDYYAIDVTNGFLDVVVRRSSVSPDLAPQLALLNSGGGTVVSGSYVGTASGVVLYSNSLPNGRYYVQIGAAPYPGNFTTYGSLGYYNLVVTRPNTPSNPAGLTRAPLGDQTITASWLPSTSELGTTVAYEAQLCDAVSVCSAVTTTSATSVTLLAPSKTGLFTARIAAVDSLGRRSATVSSAPVNVQSKPTAPLVQKLRWDDTARTLRVEWGSGTSFAPVTTTSVNLIITNRATSQQVVVTGLSDAGGSFTQLLSAAWSGVWIDVSMVSLTSFATPWDQSAPSPLTSIYTGRLDAPQATASPTTIARPAAPQAPGTSIVPRGAAPQA